MSGFQDITGTNQDNCKPPVCPDILTIRITNITCTKENFYVSWVLDNPEGTDTFITQNNVVWSTNGKDFNNISTSQSALEPYFVEVSNVLTSGTIFVKVKMNINGTIYESDTRFLNLVDCIPSVSDINIIPAKLCSCSSGGSGNPDAGGVWVKEDGVPVVPNKVDVFHVVFKHEGECYFIDQDAISQKEPLGNQTVTILDNVSFDFADCQVCCDGISPCDLSEISRSGTTNKFVEVFSIGQTECIQIQYILAKEEKESPVRVIVTNTDTGFILFDTGCTLQKTITTEDIDGLSNVYRITVSVIPDCKEEGDTSWIFTLVCCPA